MPSYICAGHREKGKTFCTNQTGVPMGQLHKAVIEALQVTFSDAKFEEYLRDQAADTEQIATRRAERENLLQQIPKLAAAEAKLAKAIAVSEDMDALVAELKATQQERRQAEARVADLEGYERDLRDQREQVERLRRVWASWAAALDADVPAARQCSPPSSPQPAFHRAGRCSRRRSTAGASSHTRTASASAWTLEEHRWRRRFAPSQ